MNGVYSGPGGNTQGPSGQASGGGFGGFAKENPTNIVDPSEGSGWDPEPKASVAHSGKTQQKAAGKKETGKSSNATLNWQQRTLQLLTELQRTKGFKELPLKLRAEVSALVDDAPNDAYL